MAHGYNANGDLTSDGLRSFSYDAEGRLSAVTTGATDASPTTRYAHNALGQRVFKTEPLYPPSQGDESDPGFFQSLIDFFTRLWGPSATEAERLGFAFTYDEEGSLIAETGTGGANSKGTSRTMCMSGQAANARSLVDQFRHGLGTNDEESLPMIDLADCIEAHVTGIVVTEEDKVVEISFRSPSSKRFRLVAEGVERFVANEFRERNIVDRMSLWNSTSEPNEYRESLATMISASDEGQVDATWLPLIEKEIATIRAGEKVFVEIEPVYGVQVALLARKAALILQT